MFRLTYLVLTLMCAGSNVLAGDSENGKSCAKLFDSENMSKECCKGMRSMAEEVNKCKKDDSEWTCADSECLLKEVDMWTGKEVDENKFHSMLNKTEQDDESLKDLIQGLRQYCLGGKYKDYPPDDVCLATKFHICVYIQSMVRCPEWKDDDTCKKMSEDAGKCKKVFEKN